MGLCRFLPGCARISRWFLQFFQVEPVVFLFDGRRDLRRSSATTVNGQIAMFRNTESGLCLAALSAIVAKSLRQGSARASLSLPFQDFQPNFLAFSLDKSLFACLAERKA